MPYIKVHKTYRNVVAISDADIIGQTYEEGDKILEIKEEFYKGREVDKKELVEAIKEMVGEDSTFNIAGEESVSAALEAGIITKEGIKTIKGIPYALVLL